MKVVCVNYTFNSEITNPDVLLDRYETLVGWAEALNSAGAQVSVIQRFGADTDITRNEIPYRFVYDPTFRNGSVLDKADRINAAVAANRPDVVHVNGLQFARQARWLQRLLKSVPVLLQDHANAPPRHWLNRRTLGRALRQMDAVSFVSRKQAQPWLDAALLDSKQQIFELMEGSSRFSLKPQAAARAQTGLTGDPLCLWVGRLDSNKDPLTVLSGFAKALQSMPNARLAMVYSSVNLLPSISKLLKENPEISSHVTLLGQQVHADLENIYNSADIFLLGSHHEGSGYALIESLACGVMPVVTDIPSFRVLTADGTVGGLWPTGDAEALARVLTSQCSLLHPGTRQEIRSFFEKHFHWDAIGRSAVNVYQRVLTSNARTQSS